MKTDLFQSCGHCWVFQICWHVECSTFTASCFRIWKSSAGIPSPPLALFVVMLPKAHLTPHSRMSGSRWLWVITPLWLSGSLRPFLCSSSVSLVAQIVKNLPAMQETQFWSLGREDPLENGMTTHSSTLFFFERTLFFNIVLGSQQIEPKVQKVPCLVHAQPPHCQHKSGTFVVIN